MSTYNRVTDDFTENKLLTIYVYLYPATLPT